MGEDRPGQLSMIAQFASSAWLPKVFGVHCGWIIVLVLVVLMFLYMKYTKHGYEIAVIGESENTARYAGMNVGQDHHAHHVPLRRHRRSWWASCVVSGANNTLYDGVAGGVGFTAITVAWLAQLNPFAMVVISALLAILEKGADTLQTAHAASPPPSPTSSPASSCSVMLGCEFFINYQHGLPRQAEERHKRKESVEMTCLLNLDRRPPSLYGTPLLFGTLRRNPHREVGQPEPGRGGHDVHGRRHGPGRCVLLREGRRNRGRCCSGGAHRHRCAPSWPARSAALIFSFLTITLRANQNVTGLALTIFGTGVGQYIGEFMRVREGGYVAVSNDLKAVFNGSPFPAILQELPVRGQAALQPQHLRLSGRGPGRGHVPVPPPQPHRPATCARWASPRPPPMPPASASPAIKYLATVIGGGISAIGGMVYIMTMVGGVWNHEGLSGVGWLAVALVIFCLWSPYRAIWGSILFGGLLILYLRMPIDLIPDQIYQILPYVVTVIVLVFLHAHDRDKQPPPVWAWRIPEER